MLDYYSSDQLRPAWPHLSRATYFDTSLGASCHVARTEWMLQPHSPDHQMQSCFIPSPDDRICQGRHSSLAVRARQQYILECRHVGPTALLRTARQDPLPLAQGETASRRRPRQPPGRFRRRRVSLRDKSESSYASFVSLTNPQTRAGFTNAETMGPCGRHLLMQKCAIRGPKLKDIREIIDGRIYRGDYAQEMVQRRLYT